MTDVAALPDWPGLLDEALAAAYLGMSPSTLQTLVARGRLKPARMEVRITRYRRRDLDAYIDALPLREANPEAPEDAGPQPVPVDPAEEGMRRVEALNAAGRKGRGARRR